MTFLIYIVAFTCCFLYFFIRVRGNTLIKALLVFLLIHGYITVFSTINHVSGYPTSERMPEDVVMLWGDIAEPAKNPEREGHIDIWVSHDATFLESFLKEYSLADISNKVSRVYRLPYTKENHKFIRNAKHRIIAGKRVGLKLATIEKASGAYDLSAAEKLYKIEYNSQRLKK